MWTCCTSKAANAATLSCKWASQWNARWWIQEKKLQVFRCSLHVTLWGRCGPAVKDVHRQSPNRKHPSITVAAYMVAMLAVLACVFNLSAAAGSRLGWQSIPAPHWWFRGFLCCEAETKWELGRYAVKDGKESHWNQLTLRSTCWSMNALPLAQFRSELERPELWSFRCTG